MQCIDDLIKIDKEHPQCCGSLIKKQNQLQARNNGNKSILKDLKKIENEYNALFDSIQENYVYREMLKYAKEKIEAYMIKNNIPISQMLAIFEWLKYDNLVSCLEYIYGDIVSNIMFHTKRYDF